MNISLSTLTIVSLIAIAAHADPICTDRPGLGSSPCSVPKGAVQVESDIFNYTTTTTNGITTQTFVFSNPVLKYGLTDKSDIEVQWAPIIWNSFNHGINQTGTGDVYIRVKDNFYSKNTVSIAFIPYAKIPSAPIGIGNGHFEEGVVIPISINLPMNFSLGFSPEIDGLKNPNNSVQHFNIINSLAISHPIGSVTVQAGLWNDINFIPNNIVKEYATDFSIAWIPTKYPTYQVDAGINTGLNSTTPDWQFYLGFSHRF